MRLSPGPGGSIHHYHLPRSVDPRGCSGTASIQQGCFLLFKSFLLFPLLIVYEFYPRCKAKKTEVESHRKNSNATGPSQLEARLVPKYTSADPHITCGSELDTASVDSQRPWTAFPSVIERQCSSLKVRRRPRRRHRPRRSHCPSSTVAAWARLSLTQHLHPRNQNSPPRDSTSPFDEGWHGRFDR